MLTINGVAVTIKRACYGFPGWVWSFVVGGCEYGIASWAAASTADAAMFGAIARLDQVTGYAGR